MDLHKVLNQYRQYKPEYGLIKSIRKSVVPNIIKENVSYASCYLDTGSGLVESPCCSDAGFRVFLLLVLLWYLCHFFFGFLIFVSGCFFCNCSILSVAFGFFCLSVLKFASFMYLCAIVCNQRTYFTDIKMTGCAPTTECTPVN